jgi:TetR/AcrR family transcriptional regulator, tetracycline repressor protein
MSVKAPVNVGLTQAMVINEALSLVDREGLDALSIRALARRLGVNPTAVVWHVGTFERLVSEMVLRAVDYEFHVDLDASWQSRLVSIANGFRAAIHAHPNLAPLIGDRLTVNASHQPAALEQVLSALTDAGLNDDVILHYFDSVIGSVVGFVVVELGRPPDDGHREWLEAINALRRSFRADEYPNLFRLRRRLSRHMTFRTVGGREAPLNASFDALVKTLIAGIDAEAQRLNRTKSIPRTKGKTP